MKYLKNLMSGVNTAATPQNQPIPGSTQVANSSGGHAWAVDDWAQLRRFLILGSEGGSYYAGEKTLTAQNANAVLRCIANDGAQAVNEIIAISTSGRAPKNDPALMALALATANGDDATRKMALDALPQVARTGTHLMHFAAFVDGMRGWGRGLRRAVGDWYNARPAADVAYQAIKYRARDDWSHRDLLRLAHPQPASDEHRTIYHWITQGWDWAGDEPHPVPALQQIWAYERARRSQDAAGVARLIRDYRLPREAVPTQFLMEKCVWEALLESMPMTALIRNLATLTRVGLLETGSDAAQKIVEQITDAVWLRKARVHPLSILTAQKTYSSGHGLRGQHQWTPVAAVVDALDTAFYRAFNNVEPTGSRILLALDVSGSMGWGNIAGMAGISPRDASAAMALVTAATEPHYETVAFQDTLKPLALSPRQRLDDVLKSTSNLPFGRTDCAQPMLWAMKNKKYFDTFIIYTDSETWFGKVHPAQALKQYRETMGIDARLIVVGMLANKFSIADPNDGGMLDVVGFDTSAPELMAAFMRGEI